MFAPRCSYLAIFLILCATKCNAQGESSCASVLSQYLQPNDIGRDTSYDDVEDDGFLCARNCTEHPEQRVCYYQFTLEQYNVMGPACDNCTQGVTEDCFNPQCVQGDGIEKTVLVINRMFMGPAIQVCYNDRVIVDVNNLMPARDVAIHWHGILQQESPYMDGVPYITQCPIPEGGKFRYDFIVDTAGTHFYHSHSAFHEFEGISGVFIVRTQDQDDPNRDLYDFDLYSHVIHIADWMHVMEDNKYPGANFNDSLITEKADSYLINGLGIYMGPNDVPVVQTPIANYTVSQGNRYRFRIIGATSHTCTVRFTIENHPMTLISTDGYDVEPVVVRTIFLRAGELFDVVINANQTERCYWIRVQGIDECEGAKQYGYLCYTNQTEQLSYTTNTEALFDAEPFPTLNNVRTGCQSDPDTYCMDEIRSLDQPPQGILDGEPDYRFFFHLKSFLFNMTFLYRSNTYHRHYIPFSGPGKFTKYGPGAVVNDNINNKTNFFPPSPFYTTEPPAELVCPEECVFCECFFYVKVDLNSVVELVLIDEISFGDILMDHPMHLHGHHFWILKQGTRAERQLPDYYTNTVINCTDPSQPCTRRPNHRDVVAVPAGGFAVVRWIANNTGTWNFHCHFTVHNHNGMSVIFQVGERETFKPVPANWPTCGDYLPVPEGLGQCSSGTSSTSSTSANVVSSAGNPDSAGSANSVSVPGASGMGIMSAVPQVMKV